MFEALHTLDDREVDLASAAAGDALGMGGVPGEADLHTGAEIDEWTRQALERKPSITLDPLKAPVTLSVIITRPITL